MLLTESIQGPGVRDLFLGNEAKKLLKTNDEFWNEPKRTQKKAVENSQHIQNKEVIRTRSEPKQALGSKYLIENKADIYFLGRPLPGRHIV